MLILFFALLVAASAFALTRSSAAALGILLVGFSQDPARKLVEGEPVIMSVMVAVVFAFAVLRLWLFKKAPIQEPFVRWSPELINPMRVYFGLVLLQLIHSLLRYGSPQLTLLGLIFYLAPFFAIAVAYHCFDRFSDSRRVVQVFCVCAFLVSVSVLLSFNGVDSELFGEVGSGRGEVGISDTRL